MRKTLFAIVVAAFALRLAYAVMSGALISPSTWEQEVIATNLIERGEFLLMHDGMPARSYTEPLYPWLAAAVYLITDHSQAALLIVQLLIAAATVWMTGYAARLTTESESAGIAAALILAIHPGFIHYSTILHPFVLDSFFFIAAAAAVVRYRHTLSVRHGMLAAFVIGAGALSRPTILVFLLPLCWIAWRSETTVTRRFARSALLAVVAFAIVAPWTVRNAFVHHTFMLTRSGTGHVFWLGHNPASSGSAMDIHGSPIREKAPLEFRQRVLAADELTRDRLYRDAAWEYIRSDPASAVGRVLQRLVHFWWFSPQWGAAFSNVTGLIYRAWWGVLLVLVAAGAALAARLPDSRDVWLLAAMAFLISVTQAVYYVEGRHRLAIEPLVLPLAAVAVTSLPWRVRGRENAPTRTEH